MNEQAIREIEAAKELCEIYFNIAAEIIGEDEVRKRRDEVISHCLVRKDTNERTSKKN